ncbi:MAG: hypothetical protein AB7S26_21110 [Sandaracinaceae bacterium]
MFDARVAWSARLLAVLACGGCVFEPLDHSARSCPCADGYICDETLDRCVRGTTSIDAGMDAGPRRDAGAIDAGAIDSGGDDAGAGDSGGIDGGSVDAGPPPSSICPVAGALVCESFEDAMMPGWTFYSAGATATNVDTMAYRGRRGLECSAGAGMGATSAFERSGVVLPTGAHLYVRAYVYVPSVPPIIDIAFFYFGDPAGSEFVALDVLAGARVELWVSMSSTSLQTPSPIPTDRWVCVRADIGIADTDGSAVLEANGKVAATANAIDTRPSGGYQHMGVGVTYTDPMQRSGRIYVDELVVSTTEVPCD